MKRLMAILATGACALSLVAGAAHADSSNRPFMTTASGTDTVSIGCDGGCVQATFNGTATSSHLGTSSWIAELTVPLTGLTLTDNGELCGPATGSATLPAANGDEVDFTYAGTICALDATNPIFGAHSFSGTYTITGGTGRFQGATGTGEITAGDDANRNAFMSDSGSIGY